MNIFRRFIIPLFAIVIGIVFVVMGFADFKHLKEYPEVEVVVTKVESVISYDADNNMTEDVTVYVSYTVDGNEYNDIVLNNASGNYKEGDVVTVRYNPEKPEEVTAATKVTAMIKIVLGAVAALAGLIMGFVAIVRGR